MRRLLLIPLCLLLLTMVRCSTDECLGNKSSLPLAEFYASDGGQQLAISNVSIWGIGAPGDSILADSVSSLSQIYLPFRIDQDTTSFVIDYIQPDAPPYAFTDTITFDYAILPTFVSSACGVVYRYEIRDIRHTSLMIDSVVCPLGVIDNENMANLKIYFRTSE